MLIIECIFATLYDKHFSKMLYKNSNFVYQIIKRNFESTLYKIMNYRIVYSL